ncbi:MAG: glycerophosphodiester phosphodiesterase [Clostridia bacterium]|nr:glycerophosphodiester phosphodiesterase [Clostridia bacterium]
MHPVLAVMLILCALCALYLFLIAPGRRTKALEAFTCRRYAHRGLWNAERPENSRAAFAAAAEKGYGIETDVRVSADGELFLFHDDSLERMTGDAQEAESLTLRELRALKLKGTSEGIPTPDELFDIVRGRVPLIIEIKTGPRVTDTCRLTAEKLLAYQGPYMVESFDPRAVRWFKKHSPGTIRGQLVMGLPKGRDKKRTLSRRLLASLVMNVMGRPHFIAAHHETDAGLPMRLIRLFHPYLAAWTVRSPQQAQALDARYDCQIFEGFEP